MLGFLWSLVGRIRDRSALGAMVLGAAGLAWAPLVATALPLPACTSGTLSGSIGSSTGCSVGMLAFSDFSYHPISSAPLASSISLGPATSNSGLTFGRTDGLPFQVAGSGVLSFEIDFTLNVDAGAPITEADIALDGIAGIASMTEFLCDGPTYVFSGKCGSSPATSLSAGPGTSSARLAFGGPVSGTKTLGLLVTIDGANAGSIANFTTTFSGATSVPEPGSLSLVAVACAALASCVQLQRRARLKRGAPKLAA